MRLKKLEITGFKSFCDKSGITFPPGVSAIVGPNGCGKSNIVDALRWAMGEQSVKQLRGKSMEDVIFAGTNGKPPLNMAEVSVTLANDNGTSPEELRDFTEIMFTRRLYRSGESAYFMNKQPCRLKDIHNIFLGSGMGAKSYAVIQQGNIGAITDAGPEERRFFIEEAAGITRYKNRKKETLRKLDATNQNLLRVKDIINEVTRQMNSLKRQANKAQKYKKYKEQIKILDIQLAAFQYDEYSQAIQKNTYLLKEFKDKDLKHAASLKKLDAAVEDIRLKQAKKDQEISDQKSDKFEIQRNIDKIENDLAHLQKEKKRLTQEIEELGKARNNLKIRNQEIQDEISQLAENITVLSEKIEKIKTNLNHEQKDSQTLRDNLAGLNKDLDAEKNHLMELVAQEAKYKNIRQNVSNNKDNMERRLKRIDEEKALAEKKVTDIKKQKNQAQEELNFCTQEIEELSERIEDIKLELKQQSQDLSSQVKEVQTMEFERNKIRSKYSALKKMEDNFDWYKDGVKAVMKKENIQGQIMGMMADILEPEPGFEPAVEAVLGESLQYILVKDRKTGADAIDYLQTQNAGRSGFVPVSSLKTNETNRNLNLCTPLLNYVSVKSGFETIAKAALGHVSVVENMAEALEAYSKNGRSQTLVTKTGNLISRRGIMIGGSHNKLSGILVKKQELKKMEKKLHFLDETLEKTRIKQENIEEKVRSLEIELQQQIEEKNQVMHDEMEAQKNLYKIEEELKHANQSLEILSLEQEQLLAESEDIEDEMEKYNAALIKITDKVKASQEKVAKTSEQISQLSSNMESFDQRIIDLRLKHTSLNAEMENSMNSLRRLNSFKDDSVNRLKNLSYDIEQKKKKQNQAENNINKYNKKLAVMYEKMQEIEASLETHESDYTQISELLKENDKSKSVIQNERDEILQKIRLLEVEQSQRKIKQENIAEQIEQLYHRPLSALAPEFADKSNSKMDLDKIKENLADFRKKLEKIGDVNMGAIAEYEQHKERFEFLEAQQTDLIQAMDDLKKVIQKINKVSQERFLETFNLVNQKLSQVFPRLFNGGAANLVLTEPNKPLESGVEFMVHPPGKKLTRLTLLSGGEKALSAIAFVFSIFLIKPASFCILDEIDAPLDEANVHRFNELLKIIGEKSQIIMITHKKKSMEFADTLFGITMEQKGISKIVSVNLGNDT